MMSFAWGQCRRYVQDETAGAQRGLIVEQSSKRRTNGMLPRVAVGRRVLNLVLQLGMGSVN